MNKFFSTVAFCFIVLNAKSQFITIGTGNDDYADHSPYAAYLDYTYNQTIYYEYELQASGSITALTYYHSGSSLAYSDSLAIWIGVVNRDYFSANNYWFPVASLTKVFEGTLSNFTLPGPITIPLQTSFLYNGVGNLVIAVNELRAGNDTGVFKGFISEFNNQPRVLGTHNSPYPIDPNNPPLSPGWGGVANITFTGLSKLSCQSPRNIRVSNIGSNSAKVNWSPSDLQSSPSGYDVYYSLSRTKPTAATASVDSTPTPADTSKVLNGLMPLTKYYTWVRGRCSSIGAKSVWTIVDSFTTTQIVTPVKLMEFTGKKQDNTNILNWRTASEQNNKGYELQRAPSNSPEGGGLEFSTISFIPSLAKNVNSTAILAYQYLDKQPLAGNSYYRLKQVDFDGHFTYSNVVLIKQDRNNELQITGLYPNPVTDVLNVSLSSPLNQHVQLIVSDVTGRPVLQQKLQINEGSNNIIVNTGSLQKGIYIIKAVCSNGYSTGVSKIVKE